MLIENHQMEMCLWSANLVPQFELWRTTNPEITREKNGTVYVVQVTYPKGSICEEQ